MTQIDDTIEIRASADRVWSVLTDFGGFSQWNPLFVNIEGMPKRGSKLSVTVDRLDSKVVKFRPVIARLEENRELTWAGPLILSRLIEVEQSFRIDSSQADKVRLQTSAQFRGLLVRSAWGTIQDHTRAGFALMNSRIQRVVECGSVAAWKSGRLRMSSDYNWKKVYQARFYHDVLKALQIIIHSPHPVEELNLETCKVAPDLKGRPAVSVEGGFPCGYHPEKLPAHADSTHPIILASLRGKAFVLDGAHRLAKAVLSGKATIPAIRLSIAESKRCVRDGFEQKVEFEQWRI